MGPLITQLLLTIIPAGLVGAIAYYFFKNYLRDEHHRRLIRLKRETRKEMIPYRIQAMERLTLYMERIDPGSLLIRVKPDGKNKREYAAALISGIDQEFEHNLTQQIYVSPACWNAIRTSKNAMINLIRKAVIQENVISAEDLREFILVNLMKGESPSQTGLEFIKKEAREMW